MNCSADVRGELFRNIVLSGGATMFEGIGARMDKELSALIAKVVPGRTYTVKAATPPMRKFSTWLGGSTIASLSSFEPMWITKAEYKEVGASVVHKKCLRHILNEVSFIPEPN